MNYVITYYVPPDTSPARLDALREYFDLQRMTKRRFGRNQTIVTNMQFDGAVSFREPDGFMPEHGILAKWLGLGQMIREGMKFPITMHDHDLFLRDEIGADDVAIRHAFGASDYISDQIVIIPESRRDDVMAYVERLERFDYRATSRANDIYGSGVRHEGRWSSEGVQLNMRPRPFADVPHKAGIKLRDLVSFHIKGVHSLDEGGECDCGNIPEDIECVHVHLGRGSATGKFFRWLKL